MLDTLGALVPRAPEALPPPAFLVTVAILAAGRGRYVGPALRNRQQIAAPRQAGRIPPLRCDAGGDGHRQRTDEGARLRLRRGKPASACPLPSPVASARAQAADGPSSHAAVLLSDATARYDDLNEGQQGDVLFEDGRTVIAIFGSMCAAAAQASPPPCIGPPSPARAPHCSWIRCGAPWSDC